MAYYLLDFIKKFNDINDAPPEEDMFLGLPEISNIMINNIPDYVDWINNYYMDKQYNGIFKIYNDKLITEKDNIISKLAEIAISKNRKLNLKVVEQNANKEFSTLPSSLLANSIIKIWEKNKQVYKVYPEIFEALINTEKIGMSNDFFEHLPCTNMYLDFSECGFKGIHGGFFNVFYDSEKIFIAMAILSNNYDIAYFTHAKLKIGDDISTKDTVNTVNKSDLMGSSNVDDKYSDIMYFFFQFIVYMATVEPDINESQITKKTYKKPKTNHIPKNKFSEVQEHEVGVRFGKEIKLLMKKIQNKETNTVNHKMHKSSPKRPHFRNGHWRRQSCGKNWSERKLIWIKPELVGLKNGEIDILIHDVK